MRNALLLALPFLLAACDGGIERIDAQQLLSSLDGPNVPTVKGALLEAAENAEKNGDYKQAIQLYRQVLDKNPDNPGIILALANCYRRDGGNDNAIAIYDSLLEKEPNNLDAKEGKGLALMAKGDFNAPGKLFEEVMKADPKRWKTLNALGILFTTRNMQPEAQQYFKEALKFSPNNPSVLNNIGLSQALERDYVVALDTLGKAADLTAPNTVQRQRIDMNTALVHASAGNLNEAQHIAETYYSGATLNNNMGLYAHLARDDRLAKAYLNMALTESTVFYEKAWNNLQALDAAPASAAPSKRLPRLGTVPPIDVKASPDAKPASAPKASPGAKASPVAKPLSASDIESIIHSSGDKAAPQKGETSGAE